jgi:predicted esterase
MTFRAVALWLTSIGFLSHSEAGAQSDRYDLGLRLRSFEKLWDATPDGEARARAITPLNHAVRSFFSLNYAKVGESLDAACQALQSKGTPSEAKRWADSLTFRPRVRLAPADAGDLELDIRELYPSGAPLPVSARLLCRVGAAPPIETEVTKLPVTLQLSMKGLSEGDHRLTCIVSVAGEPLVERQCVISLVDRVDQRLDFMRKSAAALTNTASIETATFAYLVRVLTDLRKGQVFETDYPAARLLHEAEQLREEIERQNFYYHGSRRGEFWLRIPAGRTIETVRFFAPPEKSSDAERRPIVVALHGAGASENMFFDSYGNGVTVRECQTRGWFVVAPRAGGGLGFGGAPNVLAIVEELAKRYPIDLQQVYLVGHSMGAGHAMMLSQQSPDRFAGIAALGGGGLIRKSEAFQRLPLFVGIGKDDFLIGSAERLAESINKVKIPILKLQIYENVEHMMIVREAIPDVFQFWTESRQRR